jgi:hypothetical protein
MRFAQTLTAALVLCSVAAHAETVTARIVADDHFAVYIGDASGTSLTLVGESGANLWFSQGAPFSFNVEAGDYIYVAAWDSPSYGAPHMWIGEFTTGSTTLTSNLDDWTSKYDATIKFPSLAQVSSLAQSASPWMAPLVSMPNGSGPYGNLISGSPASMIWHDNFGATSASEGGYALFRTAAPVVAVPEPSTVALVFSGLALVAGLKRRTRL